MRKAVVIYILGSILGLTVPVARVLSQDNGSGQTVAQGQRLFAAKCANCHGANLSGGLSGATFTGKWQGKPLRALYSRILTTMPMDAPGSLNEKQALALASYVASFNGVSFPDKPIATANDFEGLTFETK